MQNSLLTRGTFCFRTIQENDYAIPPPLLPYFPKSFVVKNGKRKEAFSEVCEVELDGQFNYPFKQTETKSGGMRLSDSDSDDGGSVTQPLPKRPRKDIRTPKYTAHSQIVDITPIYTSAFPNDLSRTTNPASNPTPTHKYQ